MFHLESKIQAWRQTMQAAGVTDEAVLRELESHLRDDFTRILQSSSAAEAAFAEAVANLGRPAVLKQEFDRAEISPRGRIKRLIFPINLRNYAIAALVIGPLLILGGLMQLWSMNWERYLASFSPLAGLEHQFTGGRFLSLVAAFQPIEVFLRLILVPVLGCVVLFAASDYLKRCSRTSALWLAGFYCALGWWWIFGLVRAAIQSIGMPTGRFYLWGIYYDPLRILPFSLTAIVLGGTAFYFWRRELLGLSSRAEHQKPREPETS